MEGVGSLVVVLGLYLLFIAFMLYVVICGNNKFHRNGCIGWTFRLISELLPDAARRISRKICPFWFGGSSRGIPCLMNWVCCRYAIIIFYYVIYVFFIVSYLFACYPFLDLLHPTMLHVHQFLSFFVLPWPWVVVVLLRFMDPGQITDENVESYLRAYPYDDVLYSRNFCRTLRIPVVARSRFCRYTHKRIARYDHYCPWVLAAIGARTHRLFLAFLVGNVIAATYLGYNECLMLGWSLSQEAHTIDWDDGRLRRLLQMVEFWMSEQFLVSANVFVLGVIDATLVVFVLQQSYYVSKNLTQVELTKIEEVERTVPNYAHAYDKGFLQNWKEFLCPPKIVKHPRKDYTQEIEAFRESIKKELTDSSEGEKDKQKTE
jgi:palmitoyltransferase